MSATEAKNTQIPLFKRLKVRVTATFASLILLPFALYAALPHSLVGR